MSKSTVRECAIIFNNADGDFARDENGCRLAAGHDGPHEFVATTGKIWQWETDWECVCEHCVQCEGDYCSTYWLKKPA